MIDYNHENKGFICFAYNLQRSRVFWLMLFYVMLLKLLVFGFLIDYSFIDVAVAKIRFATAMGAFGIGIIFLLPKFFVVRSLGYFFIFWSIILGIDYSMSDFSSISQDKFSLIVPLNEYFSFFSPNFLLHEHSGELYLYSTINLGFFIIFGACMLVLLASWFIYNARSSEINKL